VILRISLNSRGRSLGNKMRRIGRIIILLKGMRIAIRITLIMEIIRRMIWIRNYRI